VSTVPPGTVGVPIPEGRGRWRLTLHSRAFIDTHWSTSALAELPGARSRSLTQAWDTPAQLQFSVDGHDPAAALIRELQCDVMAWRWDDQPGAIWSTYRGCDVPVFRGIVTQSEDEVSEQTHTTTFVAHDYLSMLDRRYFTQPTAYTQVEQDTLVANLAAMAVNPVAANGQTFSPGAYLPIGVRPVNPDGTQRGASTQLRDRSYPAGTPLGQTLDDLAKVINGFDYDIIPAQRAGDIGLPQPPGMSFRDIIRVFYPYQGVQRYDCPLAYPSTVASFTRTVASSDYANMWRVIGDAPPNSADGTPPMFSETWNTDSNNINVNPVGLWMDTDNAADVNIQSTLDQKAAGDLAWTGVLTGGISPSSYTLTLRPGAYRWGAPNMGDICPVVIQSGRLNLTDNIRVLGITYNIGDDGDENIDLTVGRPTRTLTQLVTQADRDADALTRR
jgi:hypothetical protein